MYVLERIFLLVLQSSLAASVVTVSILFILKLFNKHIGIKFRNILWIIILLRFLIPIVPESRLSLFNLLSAKFQHTSNVQYNFLTQKQLYKNDKLNNVHLNDIENNEKAQTTLSEKPSFNKKIGEEKIIKEDTYSYMLKILSFLWLAVFLILTLISLIITIRFRIKVMHFKKVTHLEIETLLEECKKKANITKNIPIYICDSFKSPCIVGIVKPKIYVPNYAYTINHYEHLSHVFLHELIHYKRKDLFFNVLENIAILLHWFNPIMWLISKKMKLDRECACDAYVLEILGEEKAVEYGMTLLHFSKLFSSHTIHPKPAIFFETKSQIERRIKMIKRFKKGSYNMSAAAIACCVLIGSVALTDSVNATAVKSNISNPLVNTTDLLKKEDTQFLINSPIKSYNNLEKASKIADFKFKLPDYLPEDYAPSKSCSVFNFSPQDRSLRIYFNDKKHLFKLMVSTTNTSDFLKKELEESYKKFEIKTPEELSVESSEESLNIEGVNGTKVTITNRFRESKSINKYFVWKDEGIWYAVQYYNGTPTFTSLDLSLDTIGRIALSMKYPKEIKNVNYAKSSTKNFNIYDKEDLKNAIDLLGFNPKFPLNLNQNISIYYSEVSPLEDSNIANKEFELTSYYDKNNYSIKLNEKKFSKEYENIKQKGYFEEKTDQNEMRQIKAEPLNINNKEVFKYKYEDSYNPKNDPQISYHYLWKENGFYCTLSFDSKAENMDEIVKEFINAHSVQVQ